MRDGASDVVDRMRDGESGVVGVVGMAPDNESGVSSTPVVTLSAKSSSLKGVASQSVSESSANAASNSSRSSRDGCECRVYRTCCMYVCAHACG